MQISLETLENTALMTRCLELAAKGSGAVAPNPLVGSLIIAGQKVIGEGFHTRYGAPHAEVEAVRSVSDRSLLRGAKLFVNLEPCCHHGKTPPCTDLIIQSGIAKVIFACRDPFPLVHGKGAELLRDAGVAVESGTCARDAVILNRRFYTFHMLHRPYVVLKWAQTADGFIARKNFESKWISSEDSRTLVHSWRSEEQAVLVGYRTALYDDPELTVRRVLGRNPLRVVVDNWATLPTTLKLFDGSAETLVISQKPAHARFDRPSVNFVSIATTSPEAILQTLKERGISSVLIEGGAQLINNFIAAGLWDEARVFTAKKRFGEGIAAPRLSLQPSSSFTAGPDVVTIYQSGTTERIITASIGE